MKKIITLSLLILPLVKSFCQNSNTYSTNAILIRLQTNIHLINYLKKEGKTEQAKEIELKQNKKNEKIINAFNKEWTLSPVYFFYSQNSLEIKNKNYTSLFKDINNTPISREEFNNLKSNYIIGYFGQTSNKIKFHALNFNDADFNKLKKPLPRYVRTYEKLWFLKRNYKRIIQISLRKFQFSRI